MPTPPKKPDVEPLSHPSFEELDDMSDDEQDMGLSESNTSEGTLTPNLSFVHSEMPSTPRFLPPQTSPTLTIPTPDELQEVTEFAPPPSPPPTITPNSVNTTPKILAFQEMERLKGALTTTLPKVLPMTSVTQHFDVSLSTLTPVLRDSLKDIPVTIEEYHERILVKVGPCDLANIADEKTRCAILKDLTTQALQARHYNVSFKDVDVSASVGVKGRYQFGNVKSGENMTAYIKAKDETTLTQWRPKAETSHLATASLTALFEHAVRTDSADAVSNLAATTNIFRNTMIENTCQHALAMAPEDRTLYLASTIGQIVTPTTVTKPTTAFSNPHANRLLENHLEQAARVKLILETQLPAKPNPIFSETISCTPASLPLEITCQIRAGDPRLEIPVSIEDIQGKILVKVGPCDLARAGGHEARKAIVENVTNQALALAGYDKTFTDVNVSACVGVRGFLQYFSPFSSKTDPGSHMHTYIKTENDTQLTDWNPRGPGGPQSLFQDSVSIVAATSLATFFEHSVRQNSPATQSNAQATQAIFKSSSLKKLIDALKNVATESLTKVAIGLKNLLTRTSSTQTMREQMSQIQRRPEQGSTNAAKRRKR